MIGRGSFANVRCDTGACARRHCVLEIIDGALLVRDLGSSGGTYLDGKKLSSRAPVAAGAVIHAGQARLDVLALEWLG